MAGSVMLVLIACFSFLGPFFISHTYDQVFSSYVTIQPSLEPRPGEDSLEEAMKGVATRARVELQSFSVEGEAFTAVITAKDPIDPRATRYFDRANEFDKALSTGSISCSARIPMGVTSWRASCLAGRFPLPWACSPVSSRSASASSTGRSPVIWAGASTM
jgi:hypothetical protein